MAKKYHVSIFVQFIREKDRLIQDSQLLQKELEGAVLQVKAQYEHQLEIERYFKTIIASKPCAY